MVEVKFLCNVWYIEGLLGIFELCVLFAWGMYLVILLTEVKFSKYAKNNKIAKLHYKIILQFINILHYLEC